MSYTTSGPWKDGGKYGNLMSEIVSSDGAKGIATVWTRKFDRDAHAPHLATLPDPEGEANFRLLLHAKELLKALRGIEIIYSEYMNSWPDTTRPGFDLVKDVVQKARAVRAKVNGEAA